MAVHYPLAPEAIEQFRQVAMQMEALRTKVEQVYGMFHDSLHGWQLMSQVLEGAIQQNIAAGMTRERALQSRLTRGAGEPFDGNALHQSTIGERMAACARAGQNEIALSNLCVVSIYSFWEHETRIQIANTLQIDENDVKSDLFGDLRTMRNVILHAGGIIDQRASSMKLLKWFQPGD